MNKALYLLIAVAFAFSSCEKAAYKRFDDGFPENRWEKSNVLSHNFTISEAGEYDIAIDLSYVYGGMPFATLPVNVTVSGPDVNLTEQVNIRILDEGGEQIGDCSGDYCDLRQAVIENKTLSSGDYTITLTNDFQYEFLPNVLGVGLRVVKKKQDQ